MVNFPKLEVADPKPPQEWAEDPAADYLTLLAASPFLWALRGLVVSYAWLWFVVPFGPTPIGVAWGMGLAVSALLLSPVPMKDKKAVEFITASVTKSLVCWLMLYLAHLCT
jgi:hypothetical protein